MDVRPLILDDEFKNKIRLLIAHARANLYDFDKIKKVVKGEIPIPGDDFHIELPFDWRIVFTLEQHPGRLGNSFHWMKHISISIQDTKNGPNPVAVDEIIKEFGFPPLDSKKNHIWIERSPFIAINLIHEISEAELWVMNGKTN